MKVETFYLKCLFFCQNLVFDCLRFLSDDRLEVGTFKNGRQGRRLNDPPLKSAVKFCRVTIFTLAVEIVHYFNHSLGN